MKFSYNGFTVEVTGEDIKKLCTDMIGLFTKLKTSVDYKLPKKYIIGLRLPTGLIYQRADLKISLEKLEAAFNALDTQIAIKTVLKFRRIYIEDFIDSNYIQSVTEEKTWDEPEDAYCDFILDI